MKTYNWLSIILIIPLQLFAQQRFEKRLCRNPDPVNSYCQMHGIVQLSNGNYITGGYNDYIHPLSGIDDVDALIFVTNQFGDTIKTHSFFPSDTNYFNQFNARSINIFQSFILNKNKESIGVASITGKNATNFYDSDILIVKLDSLGDTLQTKQISHPIPGDSAMIPYCILQTFDGGYVIAGSQNSFTNNRYTSFILKLDSALNILWRKSFYIPNSNIFFRAQESPDHGIFISGVRLDPNDYNDIDPILIKVDSVGKELWRNTYYSPGANVGGDIVALSDGNFMQVTSLRVAGLQNDTSTYRLIKFNSNGNILTSKNHLRTYDSNMDIVKTSNNSLITAGIIENNYNTQTVDAFVMGIDINGDSLWFRQYGGIWPDMAWDMAPTSDGGVILCGETYSNVIPNTNSNAWLLKLDSLGLLITGIKEQEWASTVLMLTPFPNPCNEQFYITTTIPEGIANNSLGKTVNELQLYDLQSKPLKYIPIKNGTSTTSIATANLAEGTYLLVLVVNGYNVTNQKVMVIKN